MWKCWHPNQTITVEKTLYLISSQMKPTLGILLIKEFIKDMFKHKALLHNTSVYYYVKALWFWRIPTATYRTCHIGFSMSEWNIVSFGLIIFKILRKKVLHIHTVAQRQIVQCQIKVRRLNFTAKFYSNYWNCNNNTIMRLR